MKLEMFSVTNFRSITKAHKINMKDFTVLIGKNNEGKSNILKALQLAMEVLIKHSRKHYYTSSNNYYSNRSYYRWEDDFPVQLQQRKKGLQSIFRLQFQLNEEELCEFYDEFGSKINGDIDIEIKIGKNNQPEFRVPKSGKGASILTKKYDKVANFISKRISINYIKTIRTEDEVIRTIRILVSEELRAIEDDPKYINSLNTINELQQKILDDLASKLEKPLKEFMPTVKSIKMPISNEKRRMDLRGNFDVIVDDGVPTNIEAKGDGVKSLAALALLKNRNNLGTSNVIAIEEPEAHLHPSAIHQLNDILLSLSQNNQVIITTHNPLFVVRDDIKANVIVDNGNARQAKNIKEIRDVLGVKASDNLINASYVLVVEGENDKVSLTKILSDNSSKIAKALNDNILKIETMAGSGNLSYIVSNLRNTLCLYHVLLDNDDAGKNSYEKAEKEGLLTIKNVTFTNCKGMSQSEFEDCLDINSYKSIILDKYGIDLDVKEFKKSNRKWSEKVKNIFLDSGKPWDIKIEKQIKSLISDGIKSNKVLLDIHKRSSIDVLIKNIEEMVKVK